MASLDDKVNDLTVVVTKLEAREKSNTERLNEHDEVLKENSALVIAIKELAVETKYMREDLNKTIQRLDKLESKNSDKWEKFTWLVFTTFIGIIIGYLAIKIGLK